MPKSGSGRVAIEEETNGIQRWAFRIESAHRPGVTHAIAAMFSGRGLQLDGFYGWGDELNPGDGERATIIIIFRSFESRMKQMSQMLRRLHHVQRVTYLGWDDRRLQRQLIVQASPDSSLPALAAQVMAFDLGGGRYLLSGPAATVEQQMLQWLSTSPVKVESSSYMFTDCAAVSDSGAIDSGA